MQAVANALFTAMTQQTVRRRQRREEPKEGKGFVTTATGKKLRRAPGEGSLYKRGDGRWEATLSGGYAPNGTRLKIRRSAATKKVAGELLNAMKAEQGRGIDPALRDVTVGAWLDRWMRNPPRPLRPRTAITFKGNIDRHIVPALGRIRLADLTSTRVREFLTAKQTEPRKRGEKVLPPLATQTVKNILIVLRAALETAVDEDVITKNPARKYTLATTEPKIEPLTGDEVRRFLVAAQGHECEALFLVAVATGLRQGEVLGLRWQDVDFDKGTVHVRGTLQRYAEAYHWNPPKTARSAREVAIPPVVVEALRKRSIHQKEQRIAAGPAWVGNEWALCFTDDLGRPLHPRAARYRFDKVIAAAGVRPVRFHDLRHGLASFLHAEGLGARDIMDALGHSSIKMTMDTYTHLLAESSRKVADVMGLVMEVKAAN